MQITESYYVLFFLLVCAHFFVDFAVQNQFVATYKSRRTRKMISGEDLSSNVWPWVLTAHCFHHGLAVFLITQNLTVSLLEIIVHWITDFGKGEGWFNFHIDQVIHLGSKVLWFLFIYFAIV